MRFLFCTRPYLGHFYPMVPLARESVRHGHQVVVASSAELESEVIAAGLEFRRAGLHTSSSLPHRPGKNAVPPPVSPPHGSSRRLATC